MARVKGALNTRKKHKKILKLAKGFRGGESRIYRTANQAVMRSMQNAYIGRKRRKRDFRRLWIARISAAAKMNGMNYSTFKIITCICSCTVADYISFSADKIYRGILSILNVNSRL